MIEPETQADRIVRIFGGLAVMSRVTGLNRHTIASWQKSGFVPHKYWQYLLEIAGQNDIRHTPWDYIAHVAVIAARAERSVGVSLLVPASGANGSRS